jgi:ribosome-associated protein
MSRADELRAPDSTGIARPSKTRRKLEMHALQALGEALVELDPARLATLDIPERLAEAVLAARGMNQHEARRRQMQYIGRLMRDVDPGPLEAALAAWARGPAHDRERFAALERWRERLLADAAALDDRGTMAALIAAARAEQASGGPPHRFRALFRAIRAACEA